MSDRHLIEGNLRLSFRQGSSLESLTGQLQKYSSKFYYTVDGVEIHWYDSLDQVPRGTCTLESDQLSRTGKAYLRDKRTDSAICCFSERVKSILISEEREKAKSKLKVIESVRPASPIEIKSERVLTQLRPLGFEDS